MLTIMDMSEWATMMANRHDGSMYDKYWLLIRDSRKIKGAITELHIPCELQARVLKAIRNRKWLDQAATGADFGKLLAVVSPEDDELVRFQLLPRLVNRI